MVDPGLSHGSLTITAVIKVVRSGKGDGLCSAIAA